MNAPNRRAKLDRDHPHMSIRRQCAMLGLARSRVQRLMRRMGIAALGPRPRITRPAPGHAIYPTSVRPEHYLR